MSDEPDCGTCALERVHSSLCGTCGPGESTNWRASTNAEIDVLQAGKLLVEKERDRLAAEVKRLRVALAPFAEFACRPSCGCHNCTARTALEDTK